MGLFGGKSSPTTTQEGGESKDGNAAEASEPTTTTTAPTVEISDKKEPLLAKCEDSDAPIAVPNPPSGDLEGFHEDVKKPKEAEEDQFNKALKVKMNEYMEKGKGAAKNCFGLSPMVQCYLIAAGVSAAIIFGIVGAQRRKFKNVAMIGNSYFFVNDLPRLMESISGGKIFQDSCLHGSGSLLNILKTGNGMYYRWNTYDALIPESFQNSEGEAVSIYDYGACSVPQLLLGQDSMLSYENALGTFLSDGNNPCLQDLDYLEYQQSFNYTGNWDYVVLADQSKRMSFDESREDALMALNYTYAPILKMIHAKPVIVQTHAFWSSNANMTGLTDVPTFTSKIMDGAVIYKDFLRKHGGRGGKVSPVGDAFLTVWEENHDLWEQLFLGDDIHPSPKGSYLYACVLYATIYGSMPKKGTAISGDVEGELFAKARKLQTDYDYLYPTENEAKYLYGVAKKVALRGYKPKSYKTIGVVVHEEDDDDYDDYQYNNNNGGNNNQNNNNGGNDDYYYAAADDNEQQDDYQYQYQYQYANNNNNRQ